MKTLRLSVSGGDMYPGTATVNPLRGESPCIDHQCSYCYTEDVKQAFKAVREKYSGDYCLDERVMGSRWVLNPDVTCLFVQSMGDLFAKSVPDDLILAVLHHIYLQRIDVPILFQTKNPERFQQFNTRFSRNTILGTTLETDCYCNPEISKAPSPIERFFAFKKVFHGNKMVSIEPIIKMNVKAMLYMIEDLGIDLKYVSIGADSGNNGLPEPTDKEVNELIWGISHNTWSTAVRLKKNLIRRFEIDSEVAKFLWLED